MSTPHPPDLIRPPFQWRIATDEDIPALRALARIATDRLLEGFLSCAQIEASRELMVIDRQLIRDGSYYVVLEGREIVGCGGWSRRCALHGDHTGNGDADLLDPHCNPARIRAVFTHPAHTRRGIGRLIVAVCEHKAQDAGFRSFELLATLPGVPLYHACGYREIARRELTAETGVRVPGVLMRKAASDSHLALAG